MPPPKPLIWRKKATAVAASLALVGLVMAEPRRGQTVPDPDPTIAQLLRRIEERDARIADLQQRVAALEQRIATPASRVPPANAPPLASSAEQVPSTPAEGAPTVKSGAAQAAPGQIEADEEAAERALERTLVVTGALLLPFGKAEIQPSFAYIRSQQDAPAAMLFFESGRPFIGSQEVRSNS